jgi:hypothetical protein
MIGELTERVCILKSTVWLFYFDGSVTIMNEWIVHDE